MPISISKEDMRIAKTEKALNIAMSSLLKNRRFEKITVSDLCVEALISRATFYAHYTDKYDLLKHWIPHVWPKELACTNTYEQAQAAVSCHINENMPILKNLVYDADDETIGILHNFILSTMSLSDEKSETGEIYAKNVVFSSFYAGGIMTYVLWQVKKGFPPDVPLINRHLYEMIHELRDWQSTER